MTIKERLIYFIKNEGMSVCEFERLISAGNGYVSRIKNGIKPERLNEISLKFPQLNIDWLLHENGEMMQKTGSMEESQAAYTALPAKHRRMDKMTENDYRNVIKAMANDISSQQQTINVYRKLIGDLCK